MSNPKEVARPISIRLVAAVMIFGAGVFTGSIAASSTARVPAIRQSERSADSAHGDLAHDSTSPRASHRPRPDAGLMMTTAGDAGIPPLGDRTQSCAQTILADSRSLISTVRGIQATARNECIATSTPDLTPPTTERDECGVLSPQLWTRSFSRMAAYLEGLHTAAGGGPPPDRVMFAGIDCRSLSIQDYAAAAQITAYASDWTDLDFMRCMIDHERDETYVLMQMLTAAGSVPGAAEWVRGRRFSDPMFDQQANLLLVE